ncbi:MAG: NAD-dependent epimerase/dehydratase family protein [Polyangiales bacterium]
MDNNTQAQTTDIHVILGGGQIGDRLADVLAKQGHAVRVVQRTRRNESRSNVTRLAGDVHDAAFRAEAARGASVVYDCMNPQYHQWQELLLPLGAASLDVAKLARAKLVALDCLYMYGIPSGPIREDSPRNPCSKKGELRVRLEALRMAAAKSGEVQLAIGRASDFFGPGLPNSLFAPRFWQRLEAGKALECPGDPDMPHSYNYADDVAQGLATLGSDPRALGQIWHLPASSASSTRELFEHIGRAYGKPAKVRPIPQWLVQTAGLVVPMMREVAEMTYQWQHPYVLDDSRFRSTFGVEATPISQAVFSTVAAVRGIQRAA